MLLFLITFPSPARFISFIINYNISVANIYYHAIFSAEAAHYVFEFLSQPYADIDYTRMCFRYIHHIVVLKLIPFTVNNNMRVIWSQ